MSRSQFVPLDTSMADIVPASNRTSYRLEALSVGCWQSRTVTTPPSTPIEGQVYIVPVGASVAWGAPDNSIRHFYAGSWKTYTPLLTANPLFHGGSQWIGYIVDESYLRIRWNGSAWVTLP
jgi:hypothetical protein